MRQYTLHKTERLKKRKAIESLFREGKSFVNVPFRLYYQFFETSETGEPLQFGVGVSKKYFKKAVNRNRIKRLIREAYRLQKTILKELLQKQQIELKVFFIYTGNELPDYDLVFLKVGDILKRLEKEVKKDEKA
ncbi:MAG: ribonuclease P protein component [Chitinophagaceae bacterium]